MGEKKKMGMLRLLSIAVPFVIGSGVSAYAADFEISGWVSTGVGIFSSDDNPDTSAPNDESADGGNTFISDAEIHFHIMQELNNGVDVSFTAEMEINNTAAGNNNFDELYTTIRGSFGTFQLGSNDGVMEQLVPTVAGCTYFTCAADATGIVFDYRQNSSDDRLDWEVRGANTGDNVKVTYITPDVYGLRMGYSYAIDDSELSGRDTGSDPQTDGYELAVVYSSDMAGMPLAGTFDVGFGFSNLDGPLINSTGARVGGSGNARMGNPAAANSAGIYSQDGDEKSYYLAANYHVGNFTFGAAYEERKYNSLSMVDDGNAALVRSDTTKVNGVKEEGYSFGVNYGEGPLSIGVNYVSQEVPFYRVATTATAGVVEAQNYKEKASGWSVGFDYDLGSGVIIGFETGIRKDIGFDAKGSSVMLGVSF